MHITHQLKQESTQINQKEYEFFYGFSFERYLLEVQNILGEDNVSALPFQLDNDINSLKNQQCTIEDCCKNNNICESRFYTTRNTKKSL